MAVEVLRPHDPLRNNRYHSHTSPFHRRRNFPATGEGIPNLTVNQKKHSNTTQKKTSPNTLNTSPKPEKKKVKKSPKSPQRSGVPNVATNTPPPVVGQVTILKRGESLASISRSSRSENPNPNPNFISNQSLNGVGKTNVDDMYAGSGFVISPSPQSLPLPSFFGKKESSDDASENLRRLLRLDELID